MVRILLGSNRLSNCFNHWNQDLSYFTASCGFLQAWGLMMPTCGQRSATGTSWKANPLTGSTPARRSASPTRSGTCSGLAWMCPRGVPGVRQLWNWFYMLYGSYMRLSLLVWYLNLKKIILSKTFGVELRVLEGSLVRSKNNLLKFVVDKLFLNN